MPETLDQFLTRLSGILSKIPANITLPGAQILRDAAWENWKGLDPDDPGDLFTVTSIEQGAEVSASEENFDIADVEYGEGENVFFPFMRPAIDAHSGDIVRATADELVKYLKEKI
jgi:hypothetical protein